MCSQKTIVSVLVFFSLLFQFQAQAQWHGGRSHNMTSYRSFVMGDAVRVLRKKPFQRFSVGFNYVPVSATFNYRTVNELGVADSMHSKEIKGWGAGIAYSLHIPFAQTGNSSIASVFIGLNGNYYSYSGDQLVINAQQENFNGRYSYSGPGAGFMFGIPVGIDFVTGGEATLERSNRFSFTVGGGIFPMLGAGVVYEFGGVNLVAPFYAKAELGFHAGVNWKLRATYIAKSPTSFSNDRNDIFSEPITVETSLKSNDKFMLSILVQPFSFGWE